MQKKVQPEYQNIQRRQKRAAVWCRELQ